MTSFRKLSTPFMVAPPSSVEFSISQESDFGIGDVVYGCISIDCRK